MTLHQTAPKIRIKPIALVIAAGTIGLVFLYFYNPQDIDFFPRCPFYALTGLKCPGCGTLRAIHAALHLRVMDAFALNPFMVISIPVLIGLLVSRRFAFNAVAGKCILGMTLLWWIARNVWDFI